MKRNSTKKSSSGNKNEDKIIETELQQLGLTETSIVDSSSEQDLTRNKRGSTTSKLSSSSSRTSCQNAVNSSNPTNRTTNPTNVTANATECEYPIYLLSEQGRQAKGDLEVLIATGKTKDFLGRHLTYIDLDNLSEKDLLKYHRTYQSNMAMKMNDSFGKVAVKSYCHLANLFLPLKDKDKLYEDLRNDYIVVNELDRWIGWLSLRMGGLMAVAATSFMTLNNCSFGQESNFENNLGNNLSKINESSNPETGETRIRTSDGNKSNKSK